MSTKKQALGNVRFSTFSNNDRWFFQGDNRLRGRSQDTYGLGGDTPTANAENVKYNLVPLLRHGVPERQAGLFVGLGLNVSHHKNVRPGDDALYVWDESAYVTYNRQHGFDLDEQTSGGTNAGLLFDTRDNAINPERWRARERQLPHVFRGLSRRRLHLAGAVLSTRGRTRS